MRYALAILFAALLCGSADAQVFTDYGKAYRAAAESGQLLCVSVGMNPPPPHAGHVFCSVPANYTYYPKRGVGFTLVAPDGSEKLLARGYCVLIDQPGFKELLTNPHEFDGQPRGPFDGVKGGGIAIVDPEQGTVVSVLPARHWTPRNIAALFRLPRGTLTQRTLIWALMIRPERPQSVYGTPSVRCMAHAAENNRRQIQRRECGHFTPHGYLGNSSEIAAFTWPENTGIVDAAIDIVQSWRGSSGHWAAAMRPCREFGYDMAAGTSDWFGGRPAWYGTGIFVYGN
ncbi:MAG: hypothetical protein KGL39_34805 [Patescibacteria group bacterium]|nr:hypothetical protein [Patescibacteria group bacterium]